MLRLFLLFLTGCSAASDYWRMDAIATGDPRYNSSRLVYDSPDSHLKLELLKTEKETAAYLFLHQFQFSIAPGSGSAEIYFTIDKTQFKESILLREGGMRLKLSPEMTERIIFALHEGKEIAIVANGLKETIPPSAFEKTYIKFLKAEAEPLNFIRGPFE